MFIHVFCKNVIQSKIKQGFCKVWWFFFILCCWNMNFHFNVSVLNNHCYSNIIWLLVGALVQPVVVALFYVACILDYIFLTIYFCWHSSNLFLIILSPIILIDHDDFTRAVIYIYPVYKIFYFLFRKMVYILYTLVSAMRTKK